MFYSNSNSTNTSQASVYEREQSPEQIARGRKYVIYNSLNNLVAFEPAESSNSTTEHSAETVSRQGNHNGNIAGEVIMSNELANNSQNDPVSSSASVDQTITYTDLNVDSQNLDKIRGDIQNSAITSHEVGAMFRDPALEDLIKC